MDVKTFPDERALAEAVAGAMAEAIDDVVKARGECAVALSGGSTPRVLYRVLASDFPARIAWPRVHLFWGDERFVPATDPQSNYGMAKMELLNHVPCPPENVHPILTGGLTPEDAASSYSTTLREYFGHEMPRFDLVLLGIGEDCHTASLFPHSPALTAAELVVATPGRPPRITLTLPVLTNAETVFVLATGTAKAHAVARALAPDTDPTGCPAAALRNSPGKLVFWLDDAAGADVPGNTST